MADPRIHKLDAIKAFAITKKDDPNKIMQVVIPRTLSVAAGTLTNTHSALGVIVAADGYILTAADCGLMVLPHESVVVDGQEQPNGYRDKNGVIYYRYRCGGITSLGQKYITEATVSFDLKAYNMQDLLAKMDKNPDAFQLLSKDDPRPESTKSASWASYPLDDSVTLYLNTKYREAAKWMKDIQQQKKFGDRKAQQMAKRNAIKGHPNIVALGINTDVKNAEITVNCRSWFSSTGPLMLEGTALQIDLSQVLQDAVVDDGGGKVIDIASDSETLTAARADEDAAEEIDTAGADDGEGGSGSTAGMTDEIEQQDREKLLTELVKHTKTKKGKDALEKAREMLDVAEETEIGHVELDVLSEIVRLVSMA